MSQKQLTQKQTRLLLQSLKDFDSRWDASASLLRSEEDGRAYHGARESAFYALALLHRQQPGDVERAVSIIHAIINLQLLCPDQIWHGTYPYGPETPRPPKAELDFCRITPTARWQGDLLWERLTASFRKRLSSCNIPPEERTEILTQLSSSLRDVFPVVWETYDPNWREFITASFALILEEYENLLPPETVSAIEQAARESLKGARRRAESGLTPLNTNVEVMHVFIFDAFSRRFQDPDLAAYAAAYASRFSEDYRQHHAVAEFNSPTYNGVVLSYTGLLRTRSSIEEVRSMGRLLEAGLWEDLAAFYNPAMKTLCGPFSRAYGLGIEGTALPLLLYLGLDEIPAEDEPAFGPETESASVICCSDVLIPAQVKKRFLALSEEDRVVKKQFCELAERGEPGKNRSLCTATGWITDRLMIGALRGSTNTSHQLHSAVVHWRDTDGFVSGLRLRRRTKDGRLVHLRTVLFDFEASAGLLCGTIRNDTTEPVICSFEIASSHAARGTYRPEHWQVNGLACSCRLHMESADQQPKAAEFAPEIKNEDLVWLNLSLQPGDFLRLEMRFSLQSSQ